MLLKNIKVLKNFSFNEYLILFFPVAVLSGPMITNIYLFLISIIFLKNILYDRKNITIFKEIWVIIYLIFIFYNIVNGIFSSDIYNSLRSGIGQFRFLFFALFIFLFFENFKNLIKMLNIWISIVLLVSFDIYFQTIFLFNIIGMPISYGGRASSFFGHEVIAGGFITYIFVPIMFFYISKFNYLSNKIKILILFFYIFILLAVLLTGERLPMIILIGSTLLAIVYFNNFKQLIKIFLILSVLVSLVYNFNHIFKTRMDNMIYVISNFYESSWGRIYESSFMLFKDNYLFGVGLKNYRVECDLQVDPRPLHEAQFCSSHPHNFVLELLSETGLIGISIFFIFFGFILSKLSNLFKINLRKKELMNYGLGNLLILLIYIWPLKTSGSFFSTFNGSFFWLSLGLAMLISRKFHKNKF